MSRIEVGDCLQVMRAMPDNSVDAIVTDPPYGLKFMGKKWDCEVPAVEVWAEALRVLKPGGHLLAFAGTRTQHRMATRIEDAGFEIRDMIAWVYGSGFPKSLNVQQAINKAARGRPQGGADPLSANHGKFKGGCSDDNESGRGFGAGPGKFMGEQGEARGDDDGPWQGWGTALKPAMEPITVSRKPLISTVAANVLAHGTGGLNIDGCRVESGGEHMRGEIKSRGAGGWVESGGMHTPGRGFVATDSPLGRWPANLIHDGGDEVVALFPESAGQSGAVTGREPSSKTRNTFALYNDRSEAAPRGDIGSAARFFYCAKPGSEERGDGNTHPTVKPIALMRYLVRLVTPPGGLVLDPFAGSGTTCKAAMLEGFRYHGIELDPAHVAIAESRLRNTTAGFEFA